MNVNRFFRNLFRRTPSSSRRRPASRRKLPRLRLPSLRIPRQLRKLRLPELPPLRLPRLRGVNPFAAVAFEEIDTRSFLVILNWLGYVLLFISAIDYILLLYPPQLTNPNWEFQTSQGMVNNAWFGLLAVILILIPNRNRIRRFELTFLKFLRWILLLGGIVFILLIPLNINNAQRINQNTTAQLSRQQTARQEQLNNLEQAIQTQNIPPAQRQRLVEALGVDVSPDSENFKQTLIKQIQKRKQQLRQQVESEKSDQFRDLLRQTTRTSVAELLIGLFLIRLWWESRWLKQSRNKSSNAS